MCAVWKMDFHATILDGVSIGPGVRPGRAYRAGARTKASACRSAGAPTKPRRPASSRDMRPQVRALQRGPTDTAPGLEHEPGQVSGRAYATRPPVAPHHGPWQASGGDAGFYRSHRQRVVPIPLRAARDRRGELLAAERRARVPCSASGRAPPFQAALAREFRRRRRLLRPVHAPAAFDGMGCLRNQERNGHARGDASSDREVPKDRSVERGLRDGLHRARPAVLLRPRRLVPTACRLLAERPDGKELRPHVGAIRHAALG